MNSSFGKTYPVWLSALFLIGLLIYFNLWSTAWGQETRILPMPGLFVDDIHIYPENPTIHDYVNLSGSINVHAPESGFSLVQRVDQDGNVLLSLDISEDSGMVSRFLYQRVELSLGQLRAGDYYVSITKNGEELRRIEYSVVDAPPRPTSTPYPVNPIHPLLQDARIEYVEGGSDSPLQFFVHGLFTYPGTTIDQASVTMQDNMINLEMHVTQGEDLTKNFVPFEQFFEVKPLPVGDYIAVLHVNDQMVTRIPVTIHESNVRPTEIPWPLPEIPIEELVMRLDPSRLSANHPFAVIVSGWFHTSDTNIIDRNSFINDDGTIILDLTVDSDPAGAEVLTYFEDYIKVEGLPAGEYTALLNINGQSVLKQTISVWQGMPTLPPLPNDPEIPIYDLDFSIQPTMPMPGDNIQVTVKGVLPTGDTQVLYPFVEYVNGEVWLNVRIENWDSGPEVLTPFEQTFDIGSFSDGIYVVKFYANGVLYSQTRFSVGEVRIPDSNGPYQSYFVIDADQPKAGDPIPVIFKATFPTAGYVVNPMELRVEDQTVIAEVQIDEPKMDVLQVITPVKVDMGSLVLDAGVYEFVGIVNDVKLLPHRFVVLGETDQVTQLVRFSREGGFAGTNSWVEIYDQDIFLRKNELSSNTNLQRGAVPEELCQELFKLLKQLDFSTMPKVYSPDYTISDGFTYSISYDGNTVIVMEEAEVPEALNESIQILITILADLPATEIDPELVDFNESFIPFWKDY